MNILSMTQFAQHWSRSIENNIRSNSARVSDLFGAWQLAWLLAAAGVAIDLHSQDVILLRLKTIIGMTPLEQLQVAWMQQNGMPDRSTAPHQIEIEELFLKTLLQLLGKSAGAELDDSDLMNAARLITGIPEQHAADLRQLIQEIETARPKTALSLLNTTHTTERITAETVSAHLCNQSPEICKSLSLVKLPHPLATPMSWCLGNAQPSVYLGWPEQGLDGLHAAEQWALLAHEMVHIRSYLGSDNTHSNQDSSLFTREFEALKEEWRELNQRLRDMPVRTAERIKNQWQDHNEYTQLQRVRSDLSVLRTSFTGQKQNKPARAIKKEVQVRLPLTPLVYALSVRLIDQAESQ